MAGRAISTIHPQNFDYRSVPVTSPRVSGVILRGSVARGQRKGEPFVRNGQTSVILNRVNGEIRSVTVLNPDGSAAARLDPSAIY